MFKHGGMALLTPKHIQYADSTGRTPAFWLFLTVSFGGRLLCRPFDCAVQATTLRGPCLKQKRLQQSQLNGRACDTVRSIPLDSAQKAMPYVPPHLRGQSAEAKSDSNSSAPARSSSHDNLNSFDRGSGSRWGSDSGAPRRPNLPRTPSASHIDSRGSSRRSSAPVEAVIGKWEPSPRVKALDEEQIADIRQRLNVDVEVPDGQPPATPPIESFKDMVSRSQRLGGS